MRVKRFSSANYDLKIAEAVSIFKNDVIILFINLIYFSKSNTSGSNYALTLAIILYL